MPKIIFCILIYTLLSACQSEETLSNVNLDKFKVASFNLGVMNYGIDGYIPDNEIDDTVVQFDNLFASLSAEILFVQEYNQALDQAGKRSTYDETLRHLYPYAMWCNRDVAIFSKFQIHAQKLRTSKAASNRKLILAQCLINNNEIGLASLHAVGHNTDDGKLSRIQFHTEVIKLLSKFQYAVIGGDLNTFNDDELDIYKNAGYESGNIGYWGTLITHEEKQKPLDNILVKGFKLENFFVISEKARSDHYPIIAEVTF